MSDQIIQCSNLKFSYTKDSALVLDIPLWQVNEGQHLFISGVSGSGKSTLLNLLSGVTTPNSGELVVLGNALNKMSAKQLDKYRAEKVGVIFQQLNLIPYLSVMDNVLLATYFANKVNKQNIETRIKQLISKLKLPESILAKQANELSVGQQQRVAIVRAMINEPEILIADEPTSALDHQNRTAFLDVLFELVNATNCTLLFVSHDQSLAHHFESTVEMSKLNKTAETAQNKVL